MDIEGPEPGHSDSPPEIDDGRGAPSRAAEPLVSPIHVPCDECGQAPGRDCLGGHALPDHFHAARIKRATYGPFHARDGRVNISRQRPGSRIPLSGEDVRRVNSFIRAHHARCCSH